MKITFFILVLNSFLSSYPQLINIMWIELCKAKDVEKYIFGKGNLGKTI